MIIINLELPILINNEVLVSTEVGVFSDASLTTSVASATVTPPNSLTDIYIDTSLTPGNTYWLVARYILNPGGLQGLSTPMSFIASDLDNSISMKFLKKPLRQPTPVLSLVRGTSYTHMVNLKANLTTPQKGIKYVTWILVDSDNVVRFHSVKDSNNIRNIVISNPLKQGETYILRAFTTAMSDVTSPTASITFTTGFVSNRALRMGSFTATSITVLPMPNLTHIKKEVFSTNGVNLLDITDTSLVVDFSSVTTRPITVQLTPTIDNITYPPFYKYFE